MGVYTYDKSEYFDQNIYQFTFRWAAMHKMSLACSYTHFPHREKRRCLRLWFAGAG